MKQNDISPDFSSVAHSGPKAGDRLAESVRLGLVLLAGLVLRSLHLGQPIVENYVGRQTPTAMVAKNLGRGSGFLRPQLDTAPFPNYFAVEPPIYQELVVAVRGLTRLSLDSSGRLASALAATLGAWGVYSLVRRRSGPNPALAAAVAFSMLPITLRYGRAFQPDALMIGACTAGLACWDRAATGRTPRIWLLVGWILLAVGVATKATAAYVLLVAWLAILPARSWRSVALCVSTLAPTVAWYAWAGRLVASAGSRAAEDNRDIWMTIIGLGALTTVETWRYILRFLVLRAFTPLGFFASFWGLLGRSGESKLWWIWSAAATATMAFLAAKLHHEYYWLCLAPVASAGLGLAWARIDAHRPVLAFAASAVFAGSCLYVADSTWFVPEEWESIGEAAKAVAESTPVADLVVAPEALLYHSDRRGCRLEYTLAAATRAASEWEKLDRALTPLDLVEFYRTKGARWVADVGAGPDDHLRVDLHDGIRRRYKVVIDRPDVLLAELPPPSERPGHGD